MLTYELALDVIFETVKPLEEEEIPITEADKMFLAEKVVAPFPMCDGYEAGDVIAGSNTPVSPGLVLLFAAAGKTRVKVHRRPRIGIVLVGRSIQPQGEPLEQGEVYDATTYVLRSVLNRMGIQAIVFGLVSELLEAMRETFRNALDALDILLVCADGKSGESGVIRDILLSLGVKEVFWGCAIEPGRNLFFGFREKHYVFCLPSDPVCAAIVTMTVVRHSILRAMGALRVDIGTFDAIFLGKRYKNEKSLKFLLSRFAMEPGGRLVVWPCDDDGEYSPRAFVSANSITFFPQEEDSLTHGSRVQVLPM